ncbi:hypothetical protein Tco_0983680 [Tanacetum coccineum]
MEEVSLHCYFIHDKLSGSSSSIWILRTCPGKVDAGTKARLLSTIATAIPTLSRFNYLMLQDDWGFATEASAGGDIGLETRAEDGVSLWEIGKGT